MRIYHNITDDDQMVKACQPLINEIPKHLHRPSPPFANFTASTTLSICAMFAVFPSLEISTLSSLLGGSGDSRFGSCFHLCIVGKEDALEQRRLNSQVLADPTVEVFGSRDVDR